MRGIECLVTQKNIHIIGGILNVLYIDTICIYFLHAEFPMVTVQGKQLRGTGAHQARISSGKNPPIIAIGFQCQFQGITVFPIGWRFVGSR